MALRGGGVKNGVILVGYEHSVRCCGKSCVWKDVEGVFNLVLLSRTFLWD